MKQDVPKIKKKEVISQETKKTPRDFTKWHQEINLEPVMGKSWLKEYRKNKKEGKI